MKQCFLMFGLLFCSHFISAQSEEAQIRTTLTNYIDGTSYNQIDQINQAFYPNAELFLDNKDKSLMVVPIKEYISWFKGGEVGKFNGRIGRIISVDQFSNIAMAKVEILMTGRGMKYIDMFILKKIEGSWKIISKTAGSEKSNQSGEGILFIVSNADFYGSSDIRTGNSFSEIVSAYDTFAEAGYSVDFVSPEGGAVPLAYINTSLALHKEYIYNPDFMYALEHTKTPDQIDTEKFKAVYYVGGGSAMFGVPENEAIHGIVMKIYEDQKGIISSVCHGTAGIVNLKTSDGKYLVDGKNVNGYPDDYERMEEEYFKHFPFLIKKTIEERGGNFKFSKAGTPHVEVHGRLVTGQNHLSSKLVAEQIIEVIKE